MKVYAVKARVRLVPEVPDTQDVVTSLLAAALQASHAVETLKALAAEHGDADPTDLEDVKEAIKTMTDVRARLLRDADWLAGCAQPPY